LNLALIFEPYTHMRLETMELAKKKPNILIIVSLKKNAHHNLAVLLARALEKENTYWYAFSWSSYDEVIRFKVLNVIVHKLT
jgi:hypothetical protein